jgi:hypothetical protein
MSKVAISGNASGTGVFTIASPNSNTDRTLTLPDNSGTVVVTGTTPALNGITFPASQVTSADANTLDDYEEGTFTPSGFTAGYTADIVSGFYTKVGRVVSLLVNVRFSAVPAANSAVIFSGAPFISVLGGAGTCSSGVVRENSTTGAVYAFNIQNSGLTNLEINSMDGVGAGQQRTIRINEMYCCSLTYFTT